jgi:hypothetical protein
VGKIGAKERARMRARAWARARVRVKGNDEGGDGKGGEEGIATSGRLGHGIVRITTFRSVFLMTIYEG